MPLTLGQLNLNFKLIFSQTYKHTTYLMKLSKVPPVINCQTSHIFVSCVHFSGLKTHIKWFKITTTGTS